MKETPLQEFDCRYPGFLRCGNKIMRNGLGDLFDYPFCEECQIKDSYCVDCQKIHKEDQIKRLDDGRNVQ
jgi:hypothetical protein